MTSTLGIKKIQYPNGTNIATLDSSGSIAFAGASTVAGTLGVTGAVTANAGVVVDNITIDGTEIDLSSGDLDIDVAGNIRLDADDNGEIRLLDGGTQYGALKIDNSRFKIQSIVNNADMMFAGIDGGSEITALTLDMSAAGQANFNSNIFTGNTAEFVDGTGTGDKGIQLNPIGMVVSTRNGGISGIFGRQTSDGDIIQLRKSGSAVGSIGVTSGDQIYIGRNTSSQGIKLKNSALLPSSNAGADADNSKDLGSSSARWKDLYLSSGVRIGGTGTANLLSDYEEGTFTPIMEGTSGDPSVTYTLQSGYYTKIGKQVTWIADVRFSAWTGGAGTLRINQLPFTANGTGSGNYQGNVHSSYMYQGTQPTNGGGYHVTGDTKAYFTRVSDGYSTVTANSINNTAGHLMLGGTYFTNS